MNDNHNEADKQNNNAEEKDISFEDIEAHLTKRQEAIDAGLNPDEVEYDVSWEEVQAFVAKSKQDNKQPEEKKLFSFKSGDDEFDVEERRAFVATLLPDGNVRPLFESDHCLLCNGDPPNPRELYAITDMCHAQPEGKKANAIGLRVKTQVGSLVPIQIASCKQCRRNHRIAANIRLFIMLGMVGLALLLLVLDPIENALVAIHPILPLVIFLLMFPLGWLLGTASTRAYMNKKKDETKFDIETIPFVQRMIQNGWFQLYGKLPISRLVFSKERLKGDWFTK